MYWLLQLSVFKSIKSLTISLPGSHWTSAHTDPPLISNISKTVSVNIAFTKKMFLKSMWWANNMQIHKLSTCDSLFIVFSILKLWNYWNIKDWVFFSGNFFHISKTVRASTVFTKTFFIEYLMRFLIICTLVNFSSVVL